MEIQGFKSFADKITLEFKDGITGIVGPNGSGKSNIADALRWVLGEQKVSQLRGEKMEDVIFAGTQKRSPLSYARVSITFDNSDHALKPDFPEITVERKLFRSGESEYLLNGSQARLKDIREIFYDTGIGKEGYSIIGQGQIDKILQGKSDQRRELFDEACGIVKYKKRKAIALHKLENEKLNLERVNDQTSALEKRLGPLKRQSDTANKFIDYKNELKELEVNLFLLNTVSLKNKIKDCKEKEKTAQKELEETQVSLSEARSAHEEASKALSELDKKIEDINSEISQADIIKENLSGRLEVLKEQINSARLSGDNFLKRKQEIENSLNEASEEKASYEIEQEENKKELEKKTEEKERASAYLIEVQNKAAALNEESESLKEDLMENVRRKGEINALLERAKTSIEQIEKRKEELTAEAKDYSEDERKQDLKVQELSDEYEALQGKTADLLKQQEEKNSLSLELSKEEEKLKEELSSSRFSSARARARLESAKNITERYEGYSGAIKEVMALKKTKKGIIGVVADIIHVPKEYETAIETALGGNIQNIVTDNENTAKEAIEYLKTNKLGRATFLPLNAIKSRGGFRYEAALTERGALGLASSLVSTQGQYCELKEYLLGRILVVDDIDNALRIARKYRYSFMMVTLDGELLSRGGALSGGAYKSRSNFLGRRREIEELEKEIASLNGKTQELEKKLSAVSQDKQKAQREAESLNISLQEEKIALNTLEINLSQARALKASLKENFEEASVKSSQAQKEAGELNKNLSELEKDLEENSKENEKIKARIEELKEEGSSQEILEKAALKKSQDLDIELSRLKEQQSFLVMNSIKAENRLSSLRSDLEKLESSNKNLSAGIDKKQAEIEDISRSLREADERKEYLSEELEQQEKEREKSRSDNGDFFSKHEELSAKISDLDKEVFRLGQMREKYEEQHEKDLDYMWSEYELTFNRALPLRNEALDDPEKIKGRVSELKGLIKNLGTINVSSIEEYKEAKEEYDFLSSQKNDILAAQDDLLKLIKDLDRQMKKRFKEEFSKINTEFSRVFKIMFGGGDGRIKLEDEGDILNSDVSIIAQPPGKKLQNMMQLSGGEKALTAIAVLFAIQSLKPSPFCILDEIEAALDDSNITKFANYLKLLSGKIQFIVITHRKGTMEACDRLYGITMQEKGVSALLSVDLEDVKEDME